MGTADKLPGRNDATEVGHITPLRPQKIRRKTGITDARPVAALSCGRTAASTCEAEAEFPM